ncbi:helix-turn-helix transcriptional regulator [Fictibacillus sp. 7GRE50]|uniref:helix-turn-helix domain-containing protein n=1 Tax=Fictibacillus sp. 7GRE50 TaxID=2745878 RepID=UPI0018CE7827|nr:helix-turn-helix transcriptional regulator [Fictibacillus sp. 7GRE50]MBH0167159.1 helix-turn-helix transcriptional regulator [Fictibacillus sp. 7GRE50]
MYGKRLRALRKSKNLTLAQVAEKLNMVTSAYSSYEREDKKPPIDKLRFLASLYNVSTDYLLGLTDEREPKPKPNPDLFDVQKFFSHDELHWNGKPLKEDELEPIRNLLKMIFRDRD